MDFEAIDQIHSQWSMMDKMKRVIWLKGQWKQLNKMAYDYGVYLQGLAIITSTERAYAQKLIEMICSIEEQEKHAQRELADESMKEILKGIIL